MRKATTAVLIMLAVAGVSAGPSYERQVADFSRPANADQWNISLRQGMNGYELPFDLVNGVSNGTNVPIDMSGWSAQLAMRKSSGSDAVRLDGVVSNSTATFTLTSAFLASPVRDWRLTLYMTINTQIVNQASGTISIEAAPDVDSGDLVLTRSVNIGQYSWLGQFPAANVPAASAAWGDVTDKPTTFPPEPHDYSLITNPPSLFSGSYNDLTDVPTTFPPYLSNTQSVIRAATSGGVVIQNSAGETALTVGAGDKTVTTADGVSVGGALIIGGTNINALLALRVSILDAAYLAALTNLTGTGGISISGSGRTRAIDGSAFVQTNDPRVVNALTNAAAFDAAGTAAGLVSGYVPTNGPTYLDTVSKAAGALQATNVYLIEDTVASWTLIDVTYTPAEQKLWREGTGSGSAAAYSIALPIVGRWYRVSYYLTSVASSGGSITYGGETITFPNGASAAYTNVFQATSTNAFYMELFSGSAMGSPTAVTVSDLDVTQLPYTETDGAIKARDYQTTGSGTNAITSDGLLDIGTPLSQGETAYEWGDHRSADRTPYVNAYATTVTVSRANGNLQRVVMGHPLTIRWPVGVTNYASSIRLDIPPAGTNTVTLSTNQVHVTYYYGDSLTAASTDTWTTALWDSPFGTTNATVSVWKGANE